MAGGIHRGTDLGDTRCRSCRGFVVNNTDGADPALTVGTQPVLDGLRVDAAAPVRLEELGFDPEAVRHLLPKRGEMAGLDHQDQLTLCNEIGKCGFPGTGPRRRVDDHRRVRLEDRFHAIETFPADLGKSRPAMVDRGMIHRTKDAVRYIGRARDLEKMPPGLIGTRCHVR